MTTTDLSAAPDEAFHARVDPIEAAPPALEGFRERAAEALFVARGYDRRFWTQDRLLPYTDGVRRDCRYLVDLVFDEVLP